MTMKDFAKQVMTDLHPSFQAGLHDAHQALKAFPDSMSPASVLGQPGMPTPGEVDRAQNFDQMCEQQSQRVQEPDVAMEMS